MYAAARGNSQQSSSRSVPSKEHELLLAHRGALLSALKCQDLEDMVKLLHGYDLIGSDLKENFLSLQCDKVWDQRRQLRVRYLLQLVYEKVRGHEGSFDRLLKWLKDLEGEGEKVYNILCKERATGSVGEAGEVQDTERCLTEDDIPELLSVMASVAHLWEDISIALKIPINVQADIRKEGGSSKVQLYKALNNWLLGDCLKPVTTSTLKQALAGPIVGVASIADKIPTMKKTPVYSRLVGDTYQSDSAPKILFQSIDTQVTYGRSILLEVEVSNASSSVSYQWCKDGHELPDCTFYPELSYMSYDQAQTSQVSLNYKDCHEVLGYGNYQGTKSSILLVKHRNMASKHIEGNYKCWVDGEIRSNEISVKVHYPDRIRHLLGHYGHRLEEVHKDSWPPRHTKSFVKLALINRNSSDVGTHDYSVRGDMDDVLKKKDQIDYHNAFIYESGALVIVQGRPGCGKTTLAHKVTRDWSRGEDILAGAELVFLISLRIMNLNCKDSTIFELLQNFYSDSNAQLVEKFIVDNQGDKTCFILDGLDEYHRKNSYVLKILAGKLSKAMVIVFSRPLGCKTLSKVSKSMEILGFDRHQIDKYVNSYFEEHDVAQGLKKYLCDHINVLHMCYLPIHASMICYLYSLKGDELPTTETQIYEHFKLSTIMRKKRREDENFNIRDLSEEDKTRLAKISKLAFDMTTASRQVFDSSDTDIQLCNKPDSDLGLLTVDSTAKLYGDHHVYAFLHLTFQEYMAATYIFHLKKEEQLEVISNYQNSEAMMVVWKFYCGLIGMNVALHSNLQEQVNLIFSSENANTLYRIQCAFEAQVPILYDAAIEYGDQSLSFKNTTFLPSDYNAIGHVISRGSCPTLKLEFHFCKIDEDGIIHLGKVIKEKMKAITTLLFHSKEPTIAQFQSLNILLSKLTALEVLDLYDTTLDKVAIIELTKGITLSKLKCLKVQFVKIFEGYIKILQLLKFNSSSLEEIYVGQDYNKKEIQTCTCCLQSVFESCNIVSESSNKKIAFFRNVLLEQNLEFDFLTHCKLLDMTNCGIEDSLMIRITEDLKKSFSLEIIVLDYNRISGAGAASLASSLQCLSTLKHLSIVCNLIDDSGAKALASVLCQCTSLNHLNLVGNRIGDEGAVAITEAVKDMDVELYLHNDKDIEMSRWRLYYYCSRSTNLSFVSSNAVFLSRAIKCCTNLPSIEYYDSSSDVKQTICGKYWQKNYNILTIYQNLQFIFGVGN